MKIYVPLKNSFVTQGFGEAGTKPDYLAFYKSIGLKAHNGFDYLARTGDPIYFDCSCAGEVVAIYNDDPVGEGIGVDIITNDKDGLFQHRYWHLLDVSCKLGKIESGDLIGHADNTGRYTSGTHLHRDLKPLILENGVYKNKEAFNGYFGCVDITPYFKNIFILDELNNLQKQVGILEKLIKLLKLLWSNN